MDFFNSMDDKANAPDDDDDIFIDIVEQDEDDPFTPDDDDDIFLDVVEQDEYGPIGPIGPIDPYDPYAVTYEDLDSIDDECIDEYYKKHLMEIENQRFNSIPLHGKQANAYRHDIDNLKIKELRDKRYSLQKIADLYSCSRSTIRNRLKQLEI